MIQHDMLYMPSVNYLKKERYTGSYCGMRYMLEKKTKDEETLLLACVWKEPFCYEKTKEEDKEFMEFTLDKEGLAKAWEWLSEKQDEYAK